MPPKCRHSLACIPRCPTGAIDKLAQDAARQGLQRPGAAGLEFAAGGDDRRRTGGRRSHRRQETGGRSRRPLAGCGRLSPPRKGSSTAPRSPRGPRRTPTPTCTTRATRVIATVLGNMRVTEVGREYDTHTSCWTWAGRRSRCWRASRSASFRRASMRGAAAQGAPVLGLEPTGRRAPGLQFPVADAEAGAAGPPGQPGARVVSNYLCDLKVGDPVPLIGPFGTSFLMPNHPGSHIRDDLHGHGASPMRAMLLRRTASALLRTFARSRLMLFFGARRWRKLPFFGRLHRLPRISSTSTWLSRVSRASPSATCTT